MDSAHCGCGIRFRQWFNDVFSCPRCQTIIVRKDHVTMVWRGAKALLLLDQFEKHITEVLLDNRELAETSMGAATQPTERPTKMISKKDLKDMRPCDNCGEHMKAGCGEVCPNCQWVAPCATE